MRQAEVAPARTGGNAGTHSVITGWGMGREADVTIVRPTDVAELRASIRSIGHRRALPRGMGRSYGDAAQISGGLMIETTNLKGTDLDRERGIVTAQAGVTIGELLHQVVSAGWIVPVVPGTQNVTVGGAIASDIHGKNHGSVGTFGAHVEAISLLRADGELVKLLPGATDGGFEATVGGMGLTGRRRGRADQAQPDPGRDARRSTPTGSARSTTRSLPSRLAGGHTVWRGSTCCARSPGGAW